MRKILKRLSVLICGCLIAVCALSTFVGNKDAVSTPTRDVELIKQDVDYQALISSFDDSKITYNENEKRVSFEGYSRIKQSDFKDIDFVSLTKDNESDLMVEYTFEYLENINLFTLGIEIENVDGGIILDNIEGVPCLNEKGEIDIVFDVDGDMILLNDLVDNGLLEQCGWFTNALKKALPAIITVVAVAAVIAVAVVAVPAVIAAIPTVSVVTTTAIGAAGASVTTTSLVLTGGGVAAGLAAGATAAAATLPSLAIATGIVTASIAAGSMVSALAEEISLSLIDYIGNDRVYFIAYLRNNVLNVMQGLALNYYEAAYVLSMCKYIDSGILGIDLLSKIIVTDSIKNIIQQLTNLGIGKSKIGIFTEKKIDAGKLAYAFGGIWSTMPEISGDLADGYLYHFHDASHSIHVWYKTI